MQPLFELLRWETKVIARLESELHLEHSEAKELIDRHPVLIRQAWKTQQDPSHTADELISQYHKEHSHHD